jgi:hypothetical protein
MAQLRRMKLAAPGPSGKGLTSAPPIEDAIREALAHRRDHDIDAGAEDGQRAAAADEGAVVGGRLDAGQQAR